MRNVKIEIHLTNGSDYFNVVNRFTRRLIPHEATFQLPCKFVIVVISANYELEHQVDTVLSLHGLQSIKTPFTVIPPAQPRPSPVSFLTRPRALAA